MPRRAAAAKGRKKLFVSVKASFDRKACRGPAGLCPCKLSTRFVQWPLCDKDILFTSGSVQVLHAFFIPRNGGGNQGEYAHIMAKQIVRKKQRIPLSRLMIVGGAFSLCGVALLGRLAYFQLFHYQDNRASAAQQQYSDNVIQASRGSIYDATGKELARSTTLYNVTVDPQNCDQTQIDRISRELAEILGVDQEEIYEKLSQSDSRYKVLARRVDKRVADQIKNYAPMIEADPNVKNSKAQKIKVSLALETVDSREYPYGAFLASVLGFCNDDGEGFYGLEKSYNSVLAGQDGRSISLTNAHKYELSEQNEQYHAAQDGQSLVLTIDVNLQEIVERYLSDAIKSNNVQNRGCAMIMDVNTGAILAMSSKPDFDPNDPYTIYDAGYQEQLEAAESDEEYNQLSKSFRETQWKNKAITELYYPGSVFKLVTAAAALDSGVMTPNSSFYCGGHLQVSNISYSCAASTEGGTTTVHGMQQMEQALNNSCNVYFIQTGQALGVSRFYDYFNAFGFTETTGIDLPSETPYLLYYTPEKEGTHSKMGEVELASSSFGQAQKITPLQMVTAAAAVVNGGYLVTPHVVDHIVDANGNTVKTVETKIKRQVISEQVSEQMRTMMEYVVGGGQSGHSGRNAYVAGYRIGGKSGTSEQLDMELRSYDGDYRKVSSFLAVLPIDDPQIVVFAMLDDPQGENDYASRIAAPIVSNIISEAAPYLGLSTDGTSQSGTVKVPNSVGQDWALAQVELNKLGLSHRLIGHSGSVTYQYPLAYSEVPAGSTIYLYTESAEGTVTTVPNVIGKNTEQAKQMLKAANLNASVPTGGSVVTAQSISAEQQVTLGTVVELQTAEPEPEPEPETESSDEEQAEQQE